MINVDPVELQKFSDLAHRWWDPQSEFKPLHRINPLRLGYVDQIAGLKGKRVLDVGCGGGILSEAMAAAGAIVTGIDLGDRALKVAQMHLLESNLEVDYRNVAVEALAQQQPHEFDVITCMELLEHVPDPGSVVSACAKLVSPRGRCFFSTINRNPKAYLFAILGAEYVLGLLPRGTHDYARFITPAELASTCRTAGLNPDHLIGMTYNPLSGNYALAPDTSVNYILSTISD
ncbi:MAG: bifunctional 2-polyprenyl-6-hydroxyphenol methylase/3-demethylubiquinol 3-O-methyltransferase UbiG [Betaproteobacteria bacterium]